MLLGEKAGRGKLNPGNTGRTVSLMSQSLPEKPLRISRAFTDRHEAQLLKCFKFREIEVRHNARRDCLEIKRTGEEWRRLVDLEESKIREEVALHCEIQKPGGSNEMKPLKMSTENWNTALQAIAFTRQVDPFLEWLEGLPSWDGQARMKILLSTCFDTPDDTPRGLLEFASYAPLVAAIKRAKHPGFKYDQMIVLCGPQGCGKSTYWKELLPDSDYFSDDLDLAASTKERAEALSGKVIVESAELRGMSRAELNSLKAFLSRNSDHYRAAYARRADDQKRRCVIVGTTNELDCLPNDSTGNRRFVAVKVAASSKENARVIKEVLDENREQIWAEALALEKENIPIYIPPELEKAQAEENEKFRSAPNEVIEEAVAAVIAKFPHGDLSLREIQKEVFDDLKKPKPDRRDELAVIAALKQQGATRPPNPKRINGKLQRLWLLPGE